MLLLAMLLGACTHRTEMRTDPLAIAASQNIPEPVAGTEEPTGDTLLASTQPVSGVLVSVLHEHRTPDLWAQLPRHFQLPHIDNERIAVHRNWYVRHPDYLQRVTERAERYIWHIKQQLLERDMPAEIALLPIVESAYDPFAYSHGRAAGLWQFIPATGKRFGLKQDWWYDGRRDVVDSTRAALDYLEYLNKRFDGDWLLALAAYNSGEGTVSQALRHNRRKGRPTGFWNLKLPRETRAYVPKLIALAQILADPGAYGVSIEPLPDRPYFDIVETGAQIDLAIAAELAGIELDALYRLNPGFNRWATDPQGPHRLLIPRLQADEFREAVAELPPDQRVVWMRHKIKSGETLSHIAKRYRTTVAALQAANGIGGHSIRAGSYLLVPESSRGKESYRLSALQRLQAKKNSDRDGYRSEHVVGRGDTFWELSRHYKVNVRKLAAWNGMAPGDTLRVGQKLVVWTSTPKSRSRHPGAQARAIHYTVRKGDSLSRISSRFKVTVNDLRKWNGLARGGYLQPGQRLKLFVDVTSQTGT
jgi:membrane-bound lytic murein transglycosylase D